VTRGLDTFDDDRRSVIVLLGYQIAGSVIAFGGGALISGALGARAHNSAVQLLALATLIAMSCLLPSALFARRRAPGSVRRDAHRLAFRTVRIHAVLATLYALVFAGAAALVIAPIVIIPSALVAYGATRAGLRLGARRAEPVAG
jgi:hypothetical protein